MKNSNRQARLKAGRKENIKANDGWNPNDPNNYIGLKCGVVDDKLALTSIERMSDAEVFSIGDYIHGANEDHRGEILAFRNDLVNEQYCSIMEVEIHEDSTSLSWLISLKYAKKIKG